ncbi:MAG: DUF2630 family protein [Chloroflexota bacterium]
MDDQEIFTTITALVQEEHQLESQGIGHGPDSQDQARLRALEVTLDQCWDLLRQRRARRHAGQDPDEAGVRKSTTVERYLQ